MDGQSNPEDGTSSHFKMGCLASKLSQDSNRLTDRLFPFPSISEENVKQHGGLKWDSLSYLKITWEES